MLTLMNGFEYYFLHSADRLSNLLKPLGMLHVLNEFHLLVINCVQLFFCFLHLTFL